MPFQGRAAGIQAVFLLFFAFGGVLAARDGAILVGAGRYAGGKWSLPLVAGNLDLLERALAEDVGIAPGSIVRLQDKDVTRTGVWRALQEVLPRLGKGDRFFFYYSGHGTKVFTGGAPVRAYFTWDTIESLGGTGFAPETLITDVDLKRWFAPFKEKGVLVVLLREACFNGGGYAGDLSTLSPGRPPRREPVGDIELSACDVDQAAWALDGSDPPRALFTSCLAAVLDSSARKITALDLFDETRRSVTAKKRVQTPILECAPGVDPSDVVLVDRSLVTLEIGARDAVTGVEVAGALVILEVAGRPGGLRARTPARIAGIPRSPFLFPWVEKKGYVPVSRKVAVPGRARVVEAPDVLLRPEVAVVRGRIVLDGPGTLSGVLVTYYSGVRPLSPSHVDREVIPEKDGSFTLTVPPRGPCTVFVVRGTSSLAVVKAAGGDALEPVRYFDRSRGVYAGGACDLGEIHVRLPPSPLVVGKAERLFEESFARAEAAAGEGRFDDALGLYARAEAAAKSIAAPEKREALLARTRNASSALKTEMIEARIAGTLADADFRNGRDWEDQGLFDLAVASYRSALANCPEEQRAALEERIAACEKEAKAAALYEKAARLLEEARKNPSRPAFRKVIETARVLEALGKGRDYRELGKIEAEAEAEDTSDASRRCFERGVRCREAGKWREAIAFFEKAREGAGGRYPSEIEKNLGYCRLSLDQAVAARRGIVEKCFADRRFQECIAACDRWLELDPGSPEAARIRLWAVKGRAQELFDGKEYSRCAFFTRAALKDYPGDGEIASLNLRAVKEDIPPAAREAWERSLEAEEKGDWLTVVDTLGPMVGAPRGEGFNAHYLDLARPRLEEARARAFEVSSREARRAWARNDFVASLGFVEKALLCRPGHGAMLKLKAALEEKPVVVEWKLFDAARKGEEAERLDRFTFIRTGEERRAVERAMAGYGAYLDRYPEGRWSAEGRSALKRLAALTAEVAEGFSFLDEDSFAGGGAAGTVRIYRHDATGLAFALVPGGSFTMGSPSGEKDRDGDEGPAHTVALNPFFLSLTEVTQEAWLEVMGTAPWKGERSAREGPEYPAVNLSWNACREFCRRAGLRLPTEAEWEYACRAGTKTRFCSGDDDADLDDFGWYARNSRFRLHPVGRKKPNAFGLFDMHGNVWEWCEDVWHKDYSGAPADGRAWIDSSVADRVRRGGSWALLAGDCRSANRLGFDPDPRLYTVGFRPACSVPGVAGSGEGVCYYRTGDVYFGDSGSFHKPCVLARTAVFEAIGAIRTIREEKISRDSARYSFLVEKANRIFRTTVEKVAREAGFDLVVEKGGIRASRGPPVPDITSRVIQSLPKP